jgi:LysR family transcriptional regulator, glycine cleavage system transcriptional activator
LSEMKRSLLPLTALRAFEAAGRLESFKRAADELSVSEAAVSRQVRDLERDLSAPLFVRKHRAVRLTRSGRVLLTELTSSFDAIATALDAVTASSVQVISVSAEPTFANLFLVPQLGSFSEQHPELEVSLEANSALLDFREPDGPSLAIRYSLTQSSWPNVDAQHLTDDWLTPMVAPQLASALKEPADLLQFKLLRDETSDPWTRWLTAAGIHDLPDWGPTFSNAATAVQGAEFGQGAVLGNRLFCRHLIASGRVVVPFELAIPNGAYWLVHRPSAELTTAESAFRRWLMGQIEA